MPKQSKIRELVQSVSKNWSDPGPEDPLFDSGVLDSFELTDLVAALEQTYNIQVPDSDLTPRKFESIARIEAYLESRGVLIQ